MRRARDLIRHARAARWNIALTQSGHLRFRHPEITASVFAAATPGDWRAQRKALGDMRRALRISRAPGGRP